VLTPDRADDVYRHRFTAAHELGHLLLHSDTAPGDQLFAQVTNPPLDAIREELVTSLASTIGPDHNLLAHEAAACRKVVLPFPVLDNDELAKLVHIAADGDLPGLAFPPRRATPCARCWTTVSPVTRTTTSPPQKARLSREVRRCQSPVSPSPGAVQLAPGARHPGCTR
jgi:hypothetical protein